MADPIEDNGSNAALQLASVVDAVFNSPPQRANSSAPPEVQAERWFAWVRERLLWALDEVGNRRGLPVMPASPRAQVVEAAKKVVARSERAPQERP